MEEIIKVVQYKSNHIYVLKIDDVYKVLIIEGTDNIITQNNVKSYLDFIILKDIAGFNRLYINTLYINIFNF